MRLIDKLFGAIARRLVHEAVHIVEEEATLVVSGELDIKVVRKDEPDWAQSTDRRY